MAVRWVASLGQHDGQAVLLLSAGWFQVVWKILGQVGQVLLVMFPYLYHSKSLQFGETPDV